MILHLNKILILKELTPIFRAVNMSDDTITPFKIDVSKEKLDELKKKLSKATFPNEVKNAGWRLGTPLADVKSLVEYWRDVYDFSAAQDTLNAELDQYTTTIDLDGGFSSLKIHFVKAMSENPNAIPIMIVHGWPGSFFEIKKMLPLLTKGDGPVFNVIVPSLPGYGFSEGPKEMDFSLNQYAEVCHKLMLKLGYIEYVTSGGDWGMGITRIMARNYGTKFIKAYHISTVVMDPPKFVKNPLLWAKHAITPYTKEDKAALARTKWFKSEGEGYYYVHCSKPQTLGYALTDSAVALLSWIYEKLHDWTDEYQWTPDEILTWVSIYLFSTSGPAASIRTYYHANSGEEQVALKKFAAMGYIPLKLGVSLFPKDIYVPPVTWPTEMIGPVVFQARHADGGHFAAYERPEVLAKDLKTMFGKGGGAYSVVKDKSGY